MSRRPFPDPSLAAQSATRRRRPRREAKSERVHRLLHRLAIAWLLLLGGAVLTQVFPFPGSMQIGYCLMVALGLDLLGIALLLPWLMVLELREAFHRMRVLRRAAKWKREEPPTAWWEEEWIRGPR